jgi:hypothetical protein
MKYFINLDLPWQRASTELKNYLFSNFDVTKLFSWTRTDLNDVLLNCPSLTDITEPLHTSITYIAFVVYHKPDQCQIHVDADKINKARLIIPILNCEESETCFYSTEKLPIEKKQPNGVPFLYYKKEDCSVVDRFGLNDGVFLFRINKPHCVIMPENKLNFPRVSCTIALKTDLSYLLD